MELHKVIQGPGQIQVELEAATRWDAIEELLQTLRRANRIAPDNFDAIREAVRKRETSLSTGVGNGIGLPHAVTDRVQQVVGAIGISRAGVDFDAVDQQPVSLIVLFLVPKNQSEEHLDTLAKIARALGQPALRERLKAATSAQEAWQALQDSNQP